MPKNTYRHLSTKRKKFVDHMRLGYSRRQSAIKAGYSVESASSCASQILRNPDIVALIDDYEKEEPKAGAIPGDVLDPSSILRELTEIARTGTSASRVSALKVLKNLQEESTEADIRLVTLGDKGVINAEETIIKHLDALDALESLPQTLIQWAFSIRTRYEDVEGIWKLKYVSTPEPQPDSASPSKETPSTSPCP